MTRKEFILREIRKNEDIITKAKEEIAKHNRVLEQNPDALLHMEIIEAKNAFLRERGKLPPLR